MQLAVIQFRPMIISVGNEDVFKKYLKKIKFVAIYALAAKTTNKLKPRKSDE